MLDATVPGSELIKIVSGLSDSPQSQQEWLKLALDTALDFMPFGKVFKLLKGPTAKLGIKKLESQLLKIAARKTKKAGKVVKKVLPTLDATGKIHGALPKVKDFGKYSKEELRTLLKELKQSVQKRIEIASKLGKDRSHGQRQGAEQSLIKSLEKYLNQ